MLTFLTIRKWRSVLLKMTQSEFLFVLVENICHLMNFLSFAKVNTTVIIVSTCLRTQIWVKWVIPFYRKIIPKAHPVEAEGAFSQGIFFDVPTKNDLKTLASVKLAPSEKGKKYSSKKEKFEFHQLLRVWKPIIQRITSRILWSLHKGVK